MPFLVKMRSLSVIHGTLPEDMVMLGGSTVLQITLTTSAVLRASRDMPNNAQGTLGLHQPVFKGPCSNWGWWHVL